MKEKDDADEFPLTFRLDVTAPYEIWNQRTARTYLESLKNFEPGKLTAGWREV